MSLIALVAAILGFGGIAGTAAGFAKIAFSPAIAGHPNFPGGRRSPFGPMFPRR